MPSIVFTEEGYGESVLTTNAYGSVGSQFECQPQAAIIMRSSANPRDASHRSAQKWTWLKTVSEI
jgi:hypothetical protein